MYEFQAGKLLDIEVRPNKRYRVQSRSDPDVKHLVKWNALEQNYSCSCPWGTHRSKEKDCEHVFQVKERFGKVCNLCSRKGEWEKSMPAPWNAEIDKTKPIVIFFCDRCNDWLESSYRRGVSK